MKILRGSAIGSPFDGAVELRSPYRIALGQILIDPFGKMGTIIKPWYASPADLSDKTITALKFRALTHLGLTELVEMDGEQITLPSLSTLNSPRDWVQQMRDPLRLFKRTPIRFSAFVLTREGLEEWWPEEKVVEIVPSAPMTPSTAAYSTYVFGNEFTGGRWSY